MVTDKSLEKDVIIIPGWGDSGPDHWQTWLHGRHPEYQRVIQKEWIKVDPADWIGTLNRYIAGCSRPAVLVAHSTACALVAHWAQSCSGAVAGAMLVAPTDVECRETAPPEIWCFAPIPRQKLPFPSVVTASSDDPMVPMEKARELAEAWGSEVVDIGEQGHINTKSGHGAWPEGEKILQDLIKRC